MTEPATAMTPVYAEAYRLAAEGYGWNDLTVRLGIPEHRARAIVFKKRDPRKPEDDAPTVQEHRR